MWNRQKISTGFASIYRENIEFIRESELHIFLTLKNNTKQQIKEKYVENKPIFKHKIKEKDRKIKYELVNYTQEG